MSDQDRQADGAAQLPLTGYDASRFNATRHGILSRHRVLPWEREDEHTALLDALVDEHQPVGPTELHLVDELASVLWRKRRLQLAEAASYRRGLKSTLADHRGTVETALAHLDEADAIERVGSAIRAKSTDTEAELGDLASDETMTNRALARLDEPRNDAYEAALAELREDTRGWWSRILAKGADELDDGEPAPSAEAQSLRRFIEEQVMPWYEIRRRELANRPLIRDQAFGEALDPDKLERLGRYEVHLDRKFERTLSTLLRLQELRRSRQPAGPA